MTSNPGDGSMYLTGGRQRVRKGEEWNAYDQAVILRVDGGTGATTTAVSYVSPPEARASANASIVFKGASLFDNHLYVPTNTEVLIYEVPSFKRAGYLSLPWFNDVHHVCPSRAGSLLVVSTGLDMIVEVTPQGVTLREWAALGGDPWQRFSKQTDYRLVPTTKPHLSHPNYVIEIGDDVWVCRPFQEDLQCVTNPDRRVPFRGQGHDGVRRDGKIYFTTVKGTVHIVDEDTMTLEDVVDLNQIDDRKAALGWTRGILPLNHDLCWVGFSRLRPTRLQENLSWVRHGFSQFYLPTRIALYDLARRVLLREIETETNGIHAIFSILPAL
jgi:hypothetical protein